MTSPFSNDPFGDDFDKTFNRVSKGIGCWFVFCAVFGVAFAIGLFILLLKLISAI